jgi:hypothetical protein
VSIPAAVLPELLLLADGFRATCNGKCDAPKK